MHVILYNAAYDAEIDVDGSKFVKVRKSVSTVFFPVFEAVLVLDTVGLTS